MPKRVLDVGQCRPDHYALARFLTSNFDVEVDCADQLPDALQTLRTRGYDLVLVNRKLDADYSDGTAVLAAIKSDEALRSVPVMLISNYADAQAAAVAAGAVPGFGKAELSDPASVEKVRVVLEGED